jgi:predicted nucleic acid-binding protein
MNGINLFADTNVLIYLLDGNQKVVELLKDNEVYISFVTELELFGKKGLSPLEKIKIQSLISQFTIVDINSSIKRRVITLRENYTIKLPDAIIAATAIEYDFFFFTADKQMEAIKELNSVIIKI